MAEKLQYGHLNFFRITVNSFTERQRGVSEHVAPGTAPCAGCPLRAVGP